MNTTHITADNTREASAARIVYQLQLGSVLCTLMLGQDGTKLATFSQDSRSGWFIRGGIELQQLWPDQVEETIEMGRNCTTAQAGGITMHTLEWSGAPEPIHIIETPEDGAFMLFPPNCFEGHADTHDAAVA